MDLKNILGQLEQALFSRYQQAWQGRQLRGSLDPRRAYRSLGGSTDVFRRKAIREERRSAVSLVVDGSDSMRYNGGAKALEKMVNAFQEIFRHSQVNWELTSFTTYKPSSYAVTSVKGVKNIEQVSKEGAENWYYTQVSSTKLGSGSRSRHNSNLHTSISTGKGFRFKTFGKQTPQTKLGELCRRACIGGTADAHVYRHAMQRLAQQEESTKLLIYLGDGVGQGCEFLAQVSAEASAQGIITYGIGLSHEARDAVLPYAFDVHSQVDNVKNLNVQAFTKATQAIQELRRERCK